MGIGDRRSLQCKGWFRKILVFNNSSASRSRKKDSLTYIQIGGRFDGLETRFSLFRVCFVLAFILGYAGDILRLIDSTGDSGVSVEINESHTSRDFTRLPPQCKLVGGSGYSWPPATGVCAT